MKVAEKLSGNSGKKRNSEIVRGWLYKITLEGAFSTVFIMFTGGAYLTGLALMLGANDFEIALLAAVPFLTQAVQLVSAYFVDLTGQRKRITFWGSLIGRQIWWLVLPLLFFESGWNLGLLIAAVILSNMLVMIATPGWLSWMSELVPEKARARYFGVRSFFVSIATISSMIIGGLIVDECRAFGHEHAGYAIIISIGSLFAFAAVNILNRLPDKSPVEIKTSGNWANIYGPLKNRSFRRLLKVFSMWNFAIGISAPFFAPHMLSNLKMSFTQISIYTSAAALLAVLLNKSWGRMIDRVGCKPVIAFTAFGIAAIPLLWFIPREGHLHILIFESIYSGFLWAGFNLAAFNIPIANSPKQGRTIYLAAFSVVTGLSFFAASLIGGTLAQNWTDIHWHFAGQTIVNYHIIFAISSVLRFLAAFLVLTFREPKEKGVPIMIQFVGYSILRRLSIGRQLLPWFLKRVPNGETGNQTA